VELLVVMGVISLLIGLTLPAVQTAREAASRSQCLSNLRQIGMALHTYCDRNGCLPPGRFMVYDPRYSGDRYPCTAMGPEKSLLVPILPDVEQVPLYNALNQSLHVLGYENRTAQTVVVPLYACPSDPESGRPRLTDVAQLVGLGLASPGENVNAVFTSYSGCYGSFMIWWDYCRRPSPDLISQVNGSFNDSAPIGLSSFRDGLTNTILVAEKSTTTFRSLEALDPVLFTRYGWYFTGNWGDTLLTTFYPPNSFTKVSLGAVPAHVYSASSLHPGGLNVLMGDGSARFVKDSIQSWPFDPITGNPAGATRGPFGAWTNLPTPGVWQALATRAGGELIGAGEF
jgi:prepilin-type processing-associated H-X9-DG protein